ncbi:NUDIX hydrolase domain-like protein [Apiospora rasikravindrae]|uniref:NUDIX hydrolase domain-like protein n=1 Tax=Apiospora rasikravindrae TaxID=990691 RepID=A0ABR1SYP1_9PEZI
MPASNIDGAPLPVIPEHLHSYLVTPAAYLEQHKSEGVTHLVVGTVVLDNDTCKRAQARSRSSVPYAPVRGKSDRTSSVPVASPLSTPSSSPPLGQDHIFSPSPPSPTSSLSSSPPSPSERSQYSSKLGTGGEIVVVPPVAFAKREIQPDLPLSQPSCVSKHRLYSSSREWKNQQPQRVLLVQRSRHDYGGLCWEIPGGSCDPHDASILDAAARELVEEAGLRVRRFVAVVDRQRHEWLDRAEIWRKLTFIVEAESESNNDDYDELSSEERDQQDNNEQRSPLKIRLDPEEHENFVWASREDLVAGGVGERTFTWMQDEQRQVIMRAFDIMEEL